MTEPVFQTWLRSRQEALLGGEGPGEPRMHLKVRDDVLLEVKMTLGVFDMPNSY